MGLWMWQTLGAAGPFGVPSGGACVESAHLIPLAVVLQTSQFQCATAEHFEEDEALF